MRLWSQLKYERAISHCPMLISMGLMENSIPEKVLSNLLENEYRIEHIWIFVCQNPSKKFIVKYSNLAWVKNNGNTHGLDLKTLVLIL